jgi:leader peptidase (prepilin peptidase)/N-methyltransferase
VKRSSTPPVQLQPLPFKRALCLMALAITVAPMARWAIVYHSVRAGQNWQRSCPQCDTPIGVNNWRPLTPLGRCHRCHRHVGAPPWLVEALLGLVVVACAQLPPWIIPAYAWWAVVGVALCFIDVATHRLPDRLTWPAAAGFLLLAGLAAVHGYGESWLRSACAAVLLTAILSVCALIWPRYLGQGDAKYAAAIGAAAGWVSWLGVYAAITAAALLGAIVGIGLILARQASRRTEMPFGPCLFLGTLLVVAMLSA